MESSRRPNLMPEWTSLPIEKFSHSSSVPTSMNHQWTHESKRDDLFLVFQKVRVHGNGLEPYQERFMMSISAGGNILEEQDVGNLVDMTQRFESMSQTMALNMTKMDAPVQIVVKRPCVAMRYTKDPTKVQRIQVRFKYDLDYDKCLDILKNLGLPIKDAPQAAPTAPVPVARPSEPNTHARAELSNQTRLTPMPNLYAVQAKDPGPSTVDLSSSMPQQSKRPHSTSSETLRSSSVVSQVWSNPDHTPRPSSSSSYLPMPVSGTSASTFTHSGESPRNVRESSLYVNQMLGRPLQTGASEGRISGEQKSPPHTLQVPIQSPFHASVSPKVDEDVSRLQSGSSIYAPSVHNFVQPQSYRAGVSSSDVNENQARPKSMSSFYVSQMQRPDQYQISNETSLADSSSVAYGANADSAATSRAPEDALRIRRAVSSFRPGSYQDDLVNSSVMRNNSLPSQSSHDPGLPRPQSVPVADHKSHDNLWIPPKRELPFLKERENAKIRRASATKLPVLPKQTALTTPANSSTPGAPKKIAPRVAERNVRKNTPSQDGTEAVPPSAPNIAGILPTVNEKEAPLASKSVATSMPSPAAVGLPSKSVPRKRPSSAIGKPLNEVKRSKMVDQSTQTQTMSGREPTNPLRVLSGNTGSISLPPPPNILDQIDDFVKANKSRPGPLDVWQTPKYAEASDEERQTMVNDWICDNLENEDFLKLCEDTENAWRRTGLGF